MNWFKALLGINKPPHPRQADPQPLAGQIDTPWKTMAIPGAKALETALALRSTQLTHIPVALGDDEDLERLLEAMEYSSSSTEDIIQAGAALDLQTWLKERVAAEPDYYMEDDSESSPDVEPAQASPLFLAFDVSGKPKAKVHIALIPTTKPWEVPAHLKLGGWNECPAAEVHVAFFKSWLERYGALVTGIGPDTIEFSVAKPPQTLEDARTLAHEQFVYCADIVHQGVVSVENLAKVLVNSNNWYFWWD